MAETLAFQGVDKNNRRYLRHSAKERVLSQRPPRCLQSFTRRSSGQGGVTILLFHNSPKTRPRKEHDDDHPLDRGTGGGYP